MIKITVQREDRLLAINNLSAAIKSVAEALNSTPKVEVHHCNITSNGNTALVIDTTEEVDRTEIQ